MAVMEASSTAIASLLMRNLVAPIFVYADKSLFNLGEKYKLLELLRYIFITCFFFFLRFLSPFLTSLNPALDHNNKPDKNLITTGGDSAIARALIQIFSIVNDVPVSSRKYELVRSLADRIIEENQRENVEALREVNRTSLSAAFDRTLSELEAAMMELGYGPVMGNGTAAHYWLNRVLKEVRSGTWAGRGKDGADRSEEKLAAELLWLAQKLVGCGFEEEAVWRWASASNLAGLALSAEPRLQGSLVKVTAFLFKQANDLGLEEIEEGKKQQQKAVKKKMLMAWLPLLCRASNGIDVPVLNTSERAELERLLEDMVGKLEQEEEQEQVLSLWLHHFTFCPSSDWPNLQGSYDRWCTASRKQLILK